MAGIRTLIALDVGTRRVGVAVGNTLLRQGQALATIDAAGDARWASIGRVLAEWQPHALVVGVPRHPDGEPHAMTAAALRFARQLRGRHRLSCTGSDRPLIPEAGAGEATRGAACHHPCS